MFQYAFGVALRHSGNEVLYDAGWFEEIQKRKKVRTTKRNYELQVFKAEVSLASQKQVQDCCRESFFGIPLPRFIQKQTSRVIREECAYSYYREFLTVKNDAYFAGVFANNCYFDNYRRELLQAFTLKEKMSEENNAMLQEIANTNSVSIHIRRGDYVKLGLTCNLDYYYKSVDFIASRVPDAHFYIFSDDAEWVKNNLKLENPHTFVEINDSNKGYCDLELMKNCQHNITANSTFSWWASYLNQNPRKIVLTPLDKEGSEFCFLFKGGYC